VNHLLDIPGHEHVISHFEYDGSVLAVRLVSDVHPESEADAYLLKAFGVRNSNEVLSFLGRMRDHEEYVYAQWRGNVLALGAEYENELLISAERFEGSSVELSQAELTRAIHRVYGWYLAENERGQRFNARLMRIRELLTDQAKRISRKAEAHRQDSAAGVLYAQQLAFLRRLLAEIEG
jgi:hypothetical protein